MSEGPPVLVTGTGVFCSIGRDVDEFAAALRAGRSGIAVRGADDAGDAHAALRPWLSAELPAWDLEEHVAARLPAVAGWARRAARRASRSVQASVAVAVEAWARAGLDDGAVPSDRIAVIVAGNNLNGSLADDAAAQHASSPVHLRSRYALQFLDTDHVGTLSEVFGLRGEGWTVGAASASGNVAIVNATRVLLAGAADVCLVVGAVTDLSTMERQALFNLGAMAGTGRRDQPERRCRPFDADREGFVPGQGAACVILETARSAAARGVRARAALVGSAVRLDGNSQPDPTVAGEVAVMNQALRSAGLSPADVDYVNAHGTASALGDATELQALRTVFGSAGPWVNSTKGLTGHCLCAAGVVEAVATIIQLEQQFVHPNLNLDHPMDGGCRLVGGTAQPAHLSVALSNGFGFGGFNSSLVLAAVA